MKQQLRDSQADIGQKLNEIVSLRASLKENAAKLEMFEKQNKEHAHKLHSRTVEIEVSLMFLWQFNAQWQSNQDFRGHMKDREDVCFYVLHSSVSFRLFPVLYFWRLM